MFQSIEITRFRGFPQLTLEPLDRFNLLIGRNNVGKTAVLEATFLLLGPNNPELPLRVNAFRGIEQFKNDPEDLWGWLFYKNEFTRPIELEARTDTGKTRRLIVTLKAPKEVRFRDGDKRPPVGRSVTTTSTTDTSPAELFLNYRSENSSQIHTRAYIKETGLGYDRSKPVVLPTSIYFYSSTLYLIFLWRRCHAFVCEVRATRFRFKWYLTIAMASVCVSRDCDKALFNKRKKKRGQDSCILGVLSPFFSPALEFCF